MPAEMPKSSVGPPLLHALPKGGQHPLYFQLMDFPRAYKITDYARERLKETASALG
jgi:hypothetical protein